jgi:hypothetical protein
MQKAILALVTAVPLVLTAAQSATAQHDDDYCGFSAQRGEARGGYGPGWRYHRGERGGDYGPDRGGYGRRWRGQEDGDDYGPRQGRGRMGMMGRGPMMGGSMMGGGMMGNPGMMRMMFALMDTDNDGTVSLSEFQAAHERIFKAADANKDGRVTFDELQAWMQGRTTTQTGTAPSESKPAH